MEISPTSNNSNDFTISSFCNKLEFNPLLSKLVIVEQSTDATNVGLTLVFSTTFSNNSIYLESKISSVIFGLLLFFIAFSNSSFEIVIGGISVSGYILAAPGLGLRNFVSPV